MMGFSVTMPLYAIVKSSLTALSPSVVASSEEVLLSASLSASVPPSDTPESWYVLQPARTPSSIPQTSSSAMSFFMVRFLLPLF